MEECQPWDRGVAGATARDHIVHLYQNLQRCPGERRRRHTGADAHPLKAIRSRLVAGTAREWPRNPRSNLRDQETNECLKRRVFTV